MTTLKLGTRGSPLALVQARAVADLLRERAGVSSEVIAIKTTGDRLGEAPLSEAGGKRLFVKEIEEALLAGAIDLAVHSSKDLPAQLPDGLAVGAVLPREDPRDAIVLPQIADSETQPDRIVDPLDVTFGGRMVRIGTSSVRRSAQLKALHFNARFLPIRGNLDTRLRKLDSGEFDILVLAAAGLRRLNRAERISTILAADVCVPAPGQGIIAVEVRTDDSRVLEAVTKINDATSAAALRAERSVVLGVGGGCQMPLGAYAEIAGDAMTVTAIVVSADGQRVARAVARGTAAGAETVGVEAAKQLLQRGAGQILDEVRRTHVDTEGQPS